MRAKASPHFATSAQPSFNAWLDPTQAVELMSELVATPSSEPGIALITIERADKMNALNEGVIQGLRDAWQRFADSDERVAVLAAAGDRAFSVGADIKDAPREMWQGVPSIGVELYKPVIAAVHGWCIGGAYVIVQMCDLVVAAENTVFKYPEAQVGFTGGLIASAVARLPHKIAMEFMLLGQDLHRRSARTKSAWSIRWYRTARNARRRSRTRGSSRVRRRSSWRR